MSISQATKVIVIKFINIHYLLKSSAQALDFFRNKDGMLNKWSIYQLRTEYGKQTLKEISKELTKEFGKGFDGLR